MSTVFLGLRITGAKQASGKVSRLSTVALHNLQSKAQERANLTVLRFQEAMAREYTSQWSKGALAKSIKAQTQINGNGVDVKFFIANLRELKYVTAALGGHFTKFPVQPFLITPKDPKGALLIPFPNSLARQFIRGAKGQFQGSKGSLEGEGGPPRPGILTKRVLWGKKTGGFSRDVISEVAQEEGALFVRDMTEAVSNAIVSITTGG